MSKREGKLIASLRGSRTRIILSFLSILLTAGGILAVINACSRAASAANAAFTDSLNTQKEATRRAFHQKAYELAEEKYHVENAVTVSVDNVKEEAKLEVLQVSDIEYIYNEGNTKIWTAVKGHGVYTVDLSLGEFLIDNERQYVLARIPSPRLDTVGLDYEYENYLFEDGMFNGSTKDGVDLARDDLKTAQNQLQMKLASTQVYYESAQKCAEKIIRNLVKNCNQTATRLVVEVEFID